MYCVFNMYVRIPDKYEDPLIFRKSLNPLEKVLTKYCCDHTLNFTILKKKRKKVVYRFIKISGLLYITDKNFHLDEVLNKCAKLPIVPGRLFVNIIDTALDFRKEKDDTTARSFENGILYMDKIQDNQPMGVTMYQLTMLSGVFKNWLDLALNEVKQL